jgi:hypothetical protein
MPIKQKIKLLEYRVVAAALEAIASSSQHATLELDAQAAV